VNRTYRGFDGVVGDTPGMVPIADNVDFEDIVAGYDNSPWTEDQKVVADTIAVGHSTADPDKDKPYRPAEVMSEVTRNQSME
jgi:hypothetical protein